MLNETVNELSLPTSLRQSVSVDRHHPAASDVEGGAVRVEAKIQVVLPELAVPPVMVSTHHYYWHSATKPGERGGNVKTAPGDYPGVGKPEVEQIAVDEQAVAQRGAGAEKIDQRLLGGRGRYSEMGIGNDDERVAQHGAKVGGPGVQPLVGACATSPS